jgi:hypothetical protein
MGSTDTRTNGSDEYPKPLLVVAPVIAGASHLKRLSNMGSILGIAGLRLTDSWQSWIRTDAVVCMTLLLD